MKLIGITGGIGSGKSEIIRYIKANYNCRVELADEVAHKLEEPGGPCYEALVQLFGPDILTDNVINKQKLASVMFSDEANVRKVNEIVHPNVKKYLLDQVLEEENRGEIDYFFIEAALLIEGGYEKIVDELWYIYASEETRRQRLKNSRGYSDEKIDSIISKQLPEEVFKDKCNVIINNDCDLETSYSQIDKLLGR